MRNDFDVTLAVLIGGELGDMLYQQTDDFHMTFAERRHETADFAVVLAIHVCFGGYQSFHNLQVTS